MGLFSPTPGKETPANDTPVALAPDYRNALVQSRYSNTTSLLSNVTGTPVQTTYYRQHSGADEEQIGLQLDDIATYQSYQRINNLIIKFEGRPAFSFDAVQAVSSEEGTGWIIADVSPMLGDMFVRDIGDGRAGLYQITAQPELRSYAMDKIYLVTFMLLDIVTPAIQDNLDRKVVKEYYYTKDSALSGGNALITEENYTLMRELLGIQPILLRRLYEVGYFNPEETMVTRESTGYLVYDEDLVNFLTMIIAVQDVVAMKPIKRINTQVGSGFGYTKSLNVYDALLQGNPDILLTCPQHRYRYGRRQFFGTRFYGGANFSKIDYFLLSHKIDYNGMGYDNIPGLPRGYFPSEEAIVEEENYWSAGFYIGEPANEFEKLVYDFCFKNIRDRASILAYAKKALSLTGQDALYQYGVLIMMIQVSRRILAGD